MPDVVLSRLFLAWLWLGFALLLAWGGVWKVIEWARALRQPRATRRNPSGNT